MPTSTLSGARLSMALWPLNGAKAAAAIPLAILLPVSMNPGLLQVPQPLQLLHDFGVGLGVLELRELFFQYMLDELFRRRVPRGFAAPLDALPGRFLQLHGRIEHSHLNKSNAPA